MKYKTKNYARKTPNIGKFFSDDAWSICEQYNTSLIKNNPLRQNTVVLENSFKSSMQSYKNIYFDVEQSESNLWQEIESWITTTQGQESYKDFFELFFQHSSQFKKDRRIILLILRELEEVEFSNTSFINFLRYLPVIKDYLIPERFNITASEEVLRLQFNIHHTYLVLYFRDDFIIDYFSYDKDVEKDEQLVYSMKGSFCSSNLLKKSYKIERLLSMFDRKDFEEPTNPVFVHWSYSEDYKLESSSSDNDFKCIIGF